MTITELHELDAWVAEHVMGWHRQNFNNGYYKRNLLVENKFRADKHRKHGWVDGHTLTINHPQYSADPAASLKVLKQCAKSTAIPIGIGVAADGWYCEEILGFPPRLGDWKFYETLPIAICCFAKRLFSQPKQVLCTTHLKSM